MENLDCQLLIMIASVYANKQDTDDIKNKLNKHNSDFSGIKTIFKHVVVHN